MKCKLIYKKQNIITAKDAKEHTVYKFENKYVYKTANNRCTEGIIFIMIANENYRPVNIVLNENDNLEILEDCTLSVDGFKIDSH